MAKGTRTQAEATYARAQKRAREASQAMTEVQAEAKRVNDNTARLRALRLAKEAADLAAKAEPKPKAPAKKKPKAAKPDAST